MSLGAGTRLGIDEILSPLGAGDPPTLASASRQSRRCLGEGGYGAAARLR